MQRAQPTEENGMMYQRTSLGLSSIAAAFLLNIVTKRNKARRNTGVAYLCSLPANLPFVFVTSSSQLPSSHSRESHSREPLLCSCVVQRVVVCARSTADNSKAELTLSPSTIMYRAGLMYMIRSTWISSSTPSNTTDSCTAESSCQLAAAADLD